MDSLEEDICGIQRILSLKFPTHILKFMFAKASLRCSTSLVGGANVLHRQAIVFYIEQISEYRAPVHKE